MCSVGAPDFSPGGLGKVQGARRKGRWRKVQGLKWMAYGAMGIEQVARIGQVPFPRPLFTHKL